MDILKRPYTVEEMKAKADDKGYVSGNVEVDINEMINGDLDTFLDTVAEKLVNDIGLTDIKYEAVGVTNPTTIVFRVSGNISEIV